MKCSWEVVVALLVICTWQCISAADEAAPTMRELNYVAVDSPRGTELQCTVSCLMHGRYSDMLRCRLVAPDGLVAADVRAMPNESASVAAKVLWDGRSAIEVNSGRNLAGLVFAADVPHAYRSVLGSPLRTVRAWGPLYFYVPKGTTYFNIWVQADVPGEGARVTIRTPDGKTVYDENGDFDARTKVQLHVPKGLDAAAWSIQISKPATRGIYLDDVAVELGRHLPPFLATRPEWAARFAGDWRYDATPQGQGNRIAAAEPTRKPFLGVKGPEIDAAFDRDQSQGWHTTLPFTYVLDYGPNHLGNPDYIPAVSTAPPTLLHLGKDVAFNHGWGPVKALGGENQAYGKGDDVARISPQEVAERIEGLRHMVDGLHAGGVRWVMPYVCAMTINGNTDERTGFWDFYDHWDTYRVLGLGPRPDDPANWLQRNADGTLKQYYRYQGDYYPRFDPPNHRYAACWNTEGWRTWLCEVIRFAAKCGYDGAFVDNGCSSRCQCGRCLAAFRQHLKTAYSPSQRQALFGNMDPDQVTFDVEPNSPLDAAVHRFWCETTSDLMATLKQVASEERGREFAIFPNGGRPSFIQRALCDADFVMFEKSHGTYGTHPGMVFSPVFDGVKLRAYNDNILEYKFVQCLRKRVKPIILSRPGYPQSHPWLRMNANAARLGMAECGALSGGGGFLLRPRFDIYHDASNDYREFFELHPDLFAGMDSYAPIAVLACPEQDWLGHRAHMSAVRAVTGVLSEAHVLFDYVSEARLTADVLARYDAVVVTDLRYVGQEQLAAIEHYVRDGGKLLFTEDLASVH